MPALGDEFRAAREARHLSLNDVSEQLHIRAVYLDAIEHDDSSFAAPVYVRGFIRTYARFLGLDSETAVASFNAASGPATPKPHEPVAASPLRSGRRPTPWLWVAALAAAVLMGFVGYKYVELQQKDAGASVAVAGVAPSSSPPKRVAAAPVPHHPRRNPALVLKRTLQVRVTADSWMAVKVDGVAVLEGIVKAGTLKAFHGKSVDVRAGNAGGVDLTLNGKDLGLMGKPGDVVERTVTLAEQ